MAIKKMSAMVLSLLMVLNMSPVSAFSQSGGAVQPVGSSVQTAQADMNAEADKRTFIFGKDTYSFENSKQDFFKSADSDENGYRISDENLYKLYSGLSNTEKAAIKAKMGGGWDGSSFGMSAVLALMYSGDLNLEDIQPGAESLHDLKSPAQSREVSDLIQYYQLMELTVPVINAKFAMSGESDEVRNKPIVEGIKKTGLPVLIGVDLYGKGSSSKISSRTIVGYEVTENRQGNYEVSVWDSVNKNELSVLEISKDYSRAVLYEGAELTGAGEEIKVKYVLDTENADRTFNYKSFGAEVKKRQPVAGPVAEPAAEVWTGATQLTTNYTNFVVRVVDNIPEEELPGESEIPEEELPGESEIPEEELPGESEIPEEELPEESEISEEELPEESEFPEEENPNGGEDPDGETAGGEDSPNIDIPGRPGGDRDNGTIPVTLKSETVPRKELAYISIVNGRPVEGSLNIHVLGAENELSEETVMSFILPDLQEGQHYQIIPEMPGIPSSFAADSAKYSTALRRHNTSSGFYVTADTQSAGIVELDRDGAIETSLAGKGRQKLSSTVNRNKADWYTVTAESEDTGVFISSENNMANIQTENAVKLGLTVSNNFSSAAFDNLAGSSEGISVTQYKDSIISVRDSSGDSIADEALGYAVIFLTVGGSEVPGLYDVLPGSRISRPEDPLREGYAFGGWFTDMSYIKQWIFQTDTVNSDMMLVAKWEDTVLDIKPELDTVGRKFYLSGYEDGRIGPRNNITRQEVAQMLYNLLTEESREHYKTQFNNFPDMEDPNRWSLTAVSTLAAAEIVSGYQEDGKFHPDDAITRAELVSMVTKFYEFEKDEEMEFPDIEKHWAVDAINYASKNNWINGYPEDGTFRPQNKITRGETVAILNAVTGRERADFEKMGSDMREFPDNMDEDAWYYHAIQIAANSYDDALNEEEDTEEETENEPEKDISIA